MNKIRALLLFIFCGCCFIELPAANDEQIHSNQIITGFEKSSEYFYYFDYLTDDNNIVLTDGSKWKLKISSWPSSWWEKNVAALWVKGEKLKITFHINSYASERMEIFNVDRQETVWGSIAKSPSTYLRIVESKTSETDPRATILIMDNGMAFEARADTSAFVYLDRIYVFNDGDYYSLWNIELNQILKRWTYKGYIVGEKEAEKKKITLEPDTILQLEEGLNDRIIGQKEASSAVATCLMNYAAGLKNPKKPAGVFLFLGPTGVGKTELAKVLSGSFTRGSHLSSALT